MFDSAQYRDIYDRFLGPLSQDITLQVNNGTDFDEYPGVRAHVSKWQERDLVPGSSIELGDTRLIIRAETLPAGLRPLEKKDRVYIDGKLYGVIHWDAVSRKVGDREIAVECTVRG